MVTTKTVPKQSKTVSWHARTVAEVLADLNTSEDGLTQTNISERQKKFGQNAFTKQKSRTFLDCVFDQFKSALSIILLLAAIVTLILGEYVDASVITLALAVAVIVGVIQEGKASRAFETLAGSQVRTATVVRAKKKHVIEASELVPGDIVLIQGGMQVPADVRLIEAKQLALNEAPLTGEWLAVDKQTDPVSVGASIADRTNMAFQGTFVAKGYGVGVVVETGDNTVVGALAKDVQSIQDERTPLQAEMARVSRIMLVIVSVLAVTLFAVGMVQGEEMKIMLLTAIAIAVAAIPEGLPAAVTIVLAVGMEALLKRGGLVRNLLAAETLGSTTYILTDKTGTLTEARMAVTGVVHSGCQNTDTYLCDWQNDAHAHRILDIALAASDAFLDEAKNDDEHYTVRGEPMERAILEAAYDLGIQLHGKSERGARVDYMAFTSENRFAAGLAAHKGKNLLAVNGAPEYILEWSTEVAGPDGVKKLDRAMRTYITKAIDAHTKEGKRMMAVAYKDTSLKKLPEDPDAVTADLVFAGLLVFHDPIREGIADAITGVQGAGATVRLVTGDNSETALSVARAVGIAREHDIALTGTEVADMTDQELLDALHTTRVFARILPRQKMRLAQVLQKSGEIVAMTGDGINDAPALQKANIGVAIGSGTEVAKEASDLVLVKDSFAVIYAAIEEGRRIISNLRKIVAYLLSTSLSEAVLITVALFTGGMVPILPAQILWANLIEEGLMSVAFAFEKGDKNAMKRKPEDVHAEGILSHTMLWFIGFVVLGLSILLVALYAYLRYLELPIEELRSLMFLAIALDSLFIAFSFRSLSTPVWKLSLRTNVFFAVSFTVNIGLLFLVLNIPFLQYLLSYQPINARDWFLVIGYGISALLMVELLKVLYFRRGRRVA